MEDKIPAAYLAGLLDASGYLQWRDRETFTTWQLRITCPDAQIAADLKAQFGGTVTSEPNSIKIGWYSKSAIKEVLNYSKAYVRSVKMKKLIADCLYDLGKKGEKSGANNSVRIAERVGG